MPLFFQKNKGIYKGRGVTKKRTSKTNKTNKANKTNKTNTKKNTGTLSAKAEPYVPSFAFNAINHVGNKKPDYNILSVNAEPYIPINLPINTPRYKSNIERIMDCVAIDCEMITVGPKPHEKFVLAHVAICDFWGNQIYNEYVIPREALNENTDYKTEVSGVEKRHILEQGLPFDRVRNDVIKIISDKIVVGHGLDSDFKVLEFRPHPDSIWDTAVLPFYKKPSGWPDKLKHIAKRVADDDIQMNISKNGKHKSHSPLEDARAAMNIYRVHHNLPKIVYEDMGHPYTSKVDQLSSVLATYAFLSMSAPR
jgi:hypothetical protein